MYFKFLGGGVKLTKDSYISPISFLFVFSKIANKIRIIQVNMSMGQVLISAIKTVQIQLSGQIENLPPPGSFQMENTPGTLGYIRKLI